MAVDTTVQVVMPQMGESVSEGTILEWHKQEGDPVSADETIVEISTDKVDAEVPAPAAGTITKIHAAEGETVTVGAVLAEIATTDGAGNGTGAAAPAEPASATEPQGNGGNGGGAAAPEAAAPEAEAPGRSLEIVMPAWASRSARARCSSGTSSPATRSSATRRCSRSPPTRSTPRSPPPPPGSSRSCSAGGRDRERGPGPRAHDRHRRHRRRRAAPEPPSPRGRRGTPEPAEAGARPRARRSRRWHAAWPRPTASTCAGSTAAARAGRITKADVLAAAGNGGAPAAAPAPAQTAGAQPIRGAAAMLARYMDESRSIPTATSFRTITVTALDARRRELKAAGQRVSFTHLIAFAIARAATELPVMAHHFAEIEGKPQRVDDGAGEPRARGRRRAQGRHAGR